VKGEKEGNMPNVLVKDGEKYGGKYVATRSFKDRKVITFGTDPVRVYKRAKKMGAKDPVIVYVHKKGMVNVY
jgi:hypothetical protein